MKIAKQKPVSVMTAVYVTKDRYELFIVEPRSLGTIDRRSGYWYTSNGLRFVNNRDAGQYLLESPKPSAPVEAGRSIEIPKLEGAKAKPTVVVKKKVIKQQNTEKLRSLQKKLEVLLKDIEKETTKHGTYV